MERERLLTLIAWKEQELLTKESRPAATTQHPDSASCAADPVYWLDKYGWTYDPRLLPGDPYIPFHPYPRQVEFIRWLEEREERQEAGLAEKSRDIGFTSLCCAYALHGFLFRPGFACGFGSRKLELVDSAGDPKSIFEKIRMMLRKLPEWQLPKGFDWNKHSSSARLLNPETGANIIGEGGDQIGRGGRTTIFFIDEAAFLEHPQSVENSLSQTTRVPIWVSTPNGPGNPFANKRHSGRIPVFTFHWRDDPRKTEEWYRGELARLDPVTVAQEIDIDYTASLEGITIPGTWVRAAVGLDLPRGGETVGGLDIAEAGAARSVFLARSGPVVHSIQDWGQCNTTETAHRAADWGEAVGAAKLFFDCVGVGAGVRGTLGSSERKLRFTPVAVNVGEAPSETRWPSGKSSRETFANLKAELWWLARTRFEKTFEHVTGKAEHDPAEMISIPDDPRLISDLSLPLHFRTESGKIKIESKEQLARRGVKSPDFAEALVLSLAPSGGWAQDPAFLKQLAAARQ